MPKVPDDANLVVVAGPVKPLGQHEIDALNDYLKHGGRMIAMYRPQRPDNPIDETAMVKLAGEWGVKVGNDIVVDQVVRLFEGPALGVSPFVQNYGEHPITKDFKQRTIFPMARSLTAEPNLKPGLTVTPIAMTSDTSWAETDIDGMFRQQKAELDRQGHARPDRRGRWRWTATSSNSAWARAMRASSCTAAPSLPTINVSTQFFNRDFFINSADWLSGEENSISIRPRAMRSSRFRLTAEQFSIVFVFAVLLLPELLLIAGIVVWWERRN